MKAQASSADFVDQMSNDASGSVISSICRRTWTNSRRHPHRPLILTEELFRDVLAKERKRVDRSDQPLVLLLVALRNPVADNSPSIWAPVIEALSAVTRETDVLGWFEWRSVIGVILPEIRTLDPTIAARELEALISQELAARSDVEPALSFSVRLHLYPEPRRVKEQGRWPIRPEPRSWWQDHTTMYSGIKRVLDIVLSLTLLAAFFPLFLLIAAAVKMTSNGRVLFGQVRIGRMKKPFTMLKFRTMYDNVDHKVHQEYVARYIKSSAECREAGKEPCFKLTTDPRITPVGRILRKTSLDELPQLWNVLRGEMSLVGPRPPIPYELEQYKPWHYRRVLDAKPGITGLWQVTGRSRTTFDEMVRLDLRYAKTCSLWTDIKILLATPRAVISGRGAC